MASACISATLPMLSDQTTNNCLMHPAVSRLLAFVHTATSTWEALFPPRKIPPHPSRATLNVTSSVKLLQISECSGSQTSVAPECPEVLLKTQAAGSHPQSLCLRRPGGAKDLHF